jgi:hypothetical protein
MPSHLLLALGLLFSTLLLSQPTQLTFGSAQNEENYPMIRLANGDYVLAGCTNNPGFGGKDVLVTRTDSAGNVIWSRQYGGSGNETALSVAETADGGFVLGGESFSNDPNGDAFILKVDASGMMQWWKEYGDGLYDITYSMLGLADGSIISAGLLEVAPVDYDAFLMKTDANGDTLWTKVIGVPGIDHAVNVIQTSDSGFIFCGKTLSRGQGLCDCWLVKTDMNGDTLWTRTYGGAGWDESMDIIEQPNGYIVCGGTNSEGNSNYDFLLMQIDFSGNLVWVKQYGGYNVEASYCVQEVPNEGYVVGGYTETYSYTNSRGTDSANAWILKTNYTGDTSWTMVYGGNRKEECFSLAVVPDVGYAFAGYTQSFGDSLQAYLFHTDTAGYTGCFERRTSPVVHVPSFVQGNYAYNIRSGYAVTSPVMSQSNSTALRSVNCGSTLHEEVVSALTNCTIYPNPATDVVTIRTTSVMSACCLHDVRGKSLGCTYAWGGSSDEIRMQLPVAAGIYTLQITFADGSVQYQPLVVAAE